MHVNDARPVWAIGDIHGALPRLLELMRAAHIIDTKDRWAAGAAHGVLVGDYVNRGEQGAAVVASIRRWQQEAQQQHGLLTALLGNHEVLMYGVLRERQRTPYGDFCARWLLNGGRFLDLEAFEQDTTVPSWFANLPAMLKVGGTLFVHSDTLAYSELGDSVEAVNQQIRTTLLSGDLDRIAALFDLLCRRNEFQDLAAVERMLAHFQAERVVYGHTPIFARAPFLSHANRCIAIDGALWASDEQETYGFVYQLATGP